MSVWPFSSFPPFGNKFYNTTRKMFDPVEDIVIDKEFRKPGWLGNSWIKFFSPTKNGVKTKKGLHNPWEVGPMFKVVKLFHMDQEKSKRIVVPFRTCWRVIRNRHSIRGIMSYFPSYGVTPVVRVRVPLVGSCRIRHFCSFCSRDTSPLTIRSPPAPTQRIVPLFTYDRHTWFTVPLRLLRY